MTTEPADAIATIQHLRARVAELEASLLATCQREAGIIERNDARVIALEAQAREAALDALSAYGQAADAYAAQLAAEAAITRAWEMGRADGAGAAASVITMGHVRAQAIQKSWAIMPPADLITRAKGGA